IHERHGCYKREELGTCHSPGYDAVSPDPDNGSDTKRGNRLHEWSAQRVIFDRFADVAVGIKIPALEFVNLPALKPESLYHLYPGKSLLEDRSDIAHLLLAGF